VLAAWEKFDAQGRLNNAADEKQVKDLLAALSEWTMMLKRGQAT
jgi:hypothetical protein